MRSGLCFVINGVDAEKREPEISETLKEAEKFRLISNVPHEYRLPVVASQGHAFEERSELISQFTFGFEPIGSRMHDTTLAHPLPGSPDRCDDHLGEQSRGKEAERGGASDCGCA
jgi:hypothetical protein